MVLVAWSSPNHGSVENCPKLKGHRKKLEIHPLAPLKHVELPWEVSGGTLRQILWPVNLPPPNVPPPPRNKALLRAY